MIEEINRNICEINKGIRFFFFYNSDITYIFDGFTCCYYMLPKAFSINNNGKLNYENNINNDFSNLLLLKNILEKKMNYNHFYNNKKVSINSYPNYEFFYKGNELFFGNVYSKEIFLDYFNRVSNKEIFPNIYDDQCKFYNEPQI